MKQSEKLDLILKTLYERKDKAGDIVPLLEAKGVTITIEEAWRLGQKLEADGYVDYTGARGHAHVSLNGDGIEYIEEDSYSFKGHSIITNNYHNAIISSPGANLVSQSSQVNIVQNSEAINQIIERLKDEVAKDNSINSDKKQELTECIEEVESGIETGKSPKFAFKSLTELAADFASVGSLVMQLGQLAGLIPPTPQNG